MVLVDAVSTVQISPLVGAAVVAVAGFFFTFLFNRAVKATDDKAEANTAECKAQRVHNEAAFTRIEEHHRELATLVHENDKGIAELRAILKERS